MNFLIQNTQNSIKKILVKMFNKLLAKFSLKIFFGQNYSYLMFLAHTKNCQFSVKRGKVYSFFN